MARILITGSRGWTDYTTLQEALTEAVGRFQEPVVIVQGDAVGADKLAARFAFTMGPDVSVESWPARWGDPCSSETCAPGHRLRRRDGSTYCPAAGVYRNVQMVAAGADLCLAFPLGKSSGTRDCMRRAEAAGIEVINLGDQDGEAS